MSVNVVFRTEEDLSQIAKGISENNNIPDLLARILAARGISSEDANSFLSPTLREGLRDPYQIKNIKEAARKILEHVKLGDLITVYTDFDVDGVTSGSQLVLFLKKLGAQVTSYTPNRFVEGYGLSLDAMDTIARLGTKLLVTVDCGVTNVKEVRHAKEIGLDVIIIDHHQVPKELPNADIIVDPTQDGCEFMSEQLAAAGLVWMLLIVLKKEAQEFDLDQDKVTDPKEYLDLAALGTICDMVPLQGVNRVIAYRGIEALNRSERKGLLALKREAGIAMNKRLGSGQVGFAIGPRINAAGRLGEAGEVIELLTTEDEVIAQNLAKKIDSYNKERRLIEEKVKKHCLQEILQRENYQQDMAYAVYGESFHLGVIGIVAQRIVEQFNKPAAVMAMGEVVEGGRAKKIIKGSVRSIEGFHVAEILSELSSYLVQHGGHGAAGGFSLHSDKLEDFKTAFVALANKLLNADKCRRKRVVDTLCDFKELDFDTVSRFDALSPFGIGNPSPLLMTKEVRVVSVKSLGEKHLRIRFAQGEDVLDGLFWNSRGHSLAKKGNIVNVLYIPEINVYQGLSSVQLNIKEIVTI